MKNIKAIIFDAYGTLFDVNSAAEKCKDKIGDKWEGFANYWRTTQLEYTWLRSLMNRHKNFWDVTEDSLDKSMKTFKIDSSMKNELLDLYKILSPFPEVPGILKKLKENKYKLAILSNGTPSLLNELVKNNNLDNIFDDIFSIEEVRIYKPSSKVYDMPIKKYKIQKKEVAFLSANTWDVSGGGNYGYTSIWVNRNNNIFDDIFSIEEVKIYKPNSKVYDLPFKKYQIKKNEFAFLSANTWDVSGGGNYGYRSIWVNRNNNIFDNLDYKPKEEVKNLKQLLEII